MDKNLRLQMTDEQIDDMNAAIRRRAPGEYHKCRRIYNEQNRKTWEGTTRDRKLYNDKGPAYWRYYADQARQISDSKVERKHRKYWNKKAREYESHITKSGSV